MIDGPRPSTAASIFLSGSPVARWKHAGSPRGQLGIGWTLKINKATTRLAVRLCGLLPVRSWWFLGRKYLVPCECKLALDTTVPEKTLTRWSFSQEKYALCSVRLVCCVACRVCVCVVAFVTFVLGKRKCALLQCCGSDSLSLLSVLQRKTQTR